jgi:hypothetical protein
MRWLRHAAATLSLVSLGAGLLAGARAWQLSRLPFNEQGRFFDEAAGVVYQRQDALGWAALALVALAMAAWGAHRYFQRSACRALRAGPLRERTER